MLKLQNDLQSWHWCILDVLHFNNQSLICSMTTKGNLRIYNDNILKLLVVEFQIHVTSMSLACKGDTGYSPGLILLNQ